MNSSGRCSASIAYERFTELKGFDEALDVAVVMTGEARNLLTSTGINPTESVRTCIYSCIHEDSDERSQSLLVSSDTSMKLC